MNNTKGNWEVRNNFNKDNEKYVPNFTIMVEGWEDNRRPIAKLSFPFQVEEDNSFMKEAEANARLISASPDLLKASIELRQAFLDGCGTAKAGTKKNKRLVKAGEDLEKAIEKALGEKLH